MNYHKKYNSFYNSKEWKSLRPIVIVNANGLCQECLKKRKVIAGKEVHHILPIDTAEGWRRRLDMTNLIYLCSECHNKAHERISPLQKFNQFWESVENGEKSDIES